MSGFDDPGVYYSDSFGGGGGEGAGGDEGGQKRVHIKKRFREFLRQFRVGTDRTGFTYKYRSVHNHHTPAGNRVWCVKRVLSRVTLVSDAAEHVALDLLTVRSTVSYSLMWEMSNV